MLAEELERLEIPVVLVRNKMDLVNSMDGVDTGNALALKWAATCDVSATTGVGLQEMEHALAVLLLGDATCSANAPMLCRAHQKHSMRRAATALENLLDNNDASPEFLAMDLREALHAIGEVSGETTPEDVLDRIFSSFCIGK